MSVPKIEEPAQSDIARALDETAAISNQLTASYAALKAAIKPLSDSLVAEQHARRDGEWQKFYAEHRGHSSAAVAAMHDAFNAGWAARKQADYEMVFGLDTPRKA